MVGRVILYCSQDRYLLVAKIILYCTPERFLFRGKIILYCAQERKSSRRILKKRKLCIDVYHYIIKVID